MSRALNNTRTQLDKPTDLGGDWEVGAESTSYSSHISDEAERTQVNFHVKAVDYKLLKCLYQYEGFLTLQWKVLMVFCQRFLKRTPILLM